MLKGCWRRSKGAFFRTRLRILFWEIRYAWQRAWLGYDRAEVGDIGHTLIARTLPVLETFRKYNVGCFPNRETGESFPYSETCSILDHMIKLLKVANYNWYEDGLHYPNDKAHSRVRAKANGCHSIVPETVFKMVLRPVVLRNFLCGVSQPLF